MVVNLHQIAEQLPIPHTRWDKQTVVLICKNEEQMSNVSGLLNNQRKSQSRHIICNGIISESFVNLNYDPSDKNPSNRCVRIVYVNDSIITQETVNSRFPDGYIIRVKGEINNGTRNDCGRISEVSRIERC